MIAQGNGGTLLAATTSASAFNAYPGFPGYTSSKAAANGLVRAASLEWGRYGIRANGLAPTHGMSVNFALPPEADVLGLSYEQMEPVGPTDRAMPLRLDTPPTIRDNANLALFLVSDEARYMSGQDIESVDGGNFARTSIIMPAISARVISCSRPPSRTPSTRRAEPDVGLLDGKVGFITGAAAGRAGAMPCVSPPKAPTSSPSTSAPPRRR